VSADEALNGGFERSEGSAGSAWFGTATPVVPAPAPAEASGDRASATYDLRPGANGIGDTARTAAKLASRDDGAPDAGHDFSAEPSGIGDQAATAAKLTAFGSGAPAAGRDFGAEPTGIGDQAATAAKLTAYGNGAPAGVAFAEPGLADDIDLPDFGIGGGDGVPAFADGSPFGGAANGLAFADPVPSQHPEPGPGPGTLRLVVVTAGLGQPSTARILADRLAEAASARLGKRGRQVWVELLELRDLALDIAGAMVAGFPGAKLRAALDSVENADGLIAVSPIYTASYSGLFKSFFDVLDKDALTGKPTLIAATGGTARHSLALDHALRPMFAYLRAFIVPTAVFAASEDWASTGEMSLNERIERAGTELGDLMAGTPASAARKPRDEFEDVVPFEQRMAALRSGI
jgi:FMN reductase